MTYYRLTARLLSPLMVQENRQTNAPRGLDYLPGSSLRGALAAHHLRSGGDPEDAAFRQIFLENPVRFPDLLPSNSPEQIPVPLPMTACSCKRSPGFIREKGHGVADSLASLVAGEVEARPLSKILVCKNCQQDLKPLLGFWNGDVPCPEKSEPIPVYQRHTGIDRYTGTVASTIFYITQGLSESRKGPDHQYQPQFLCGGTFLNGNQFEVLSSMLMETIFAGADRTRGMGEMEITLEESTPPDFDLKDWDRDFRKKLTGLTGKEIPPGFFFSFGLTGHAILVDRFLRPSLEIPVDFPGIESVLRIIRQHTVRGWQSRWGLPKSDDTAAGMGSVYLFRYQGEDREGLESLLKQLTINGIGLRRAEGFGRIRLCDPLHVQEVI